MTVRMDSLYTLTKLNGFAFKMVRYVSLVPRITAFLCDGPKSITFSTSAVLRDCNKPVITVVSE